jgi:hypothetical protein
MICGLHITLLKQAESFGEVKCKTFPNVKPFFVRINHGLPEAAAQGLARAHGV